MCFCSSLCSSFFYTRVHISLIWLYTLIPVTDIKAENRSGKTFVQFPAPLSSEKLKENFFQCFKDFVAKDKSFILIPIDNIKNWTKRTFCEAVLEGFIVLAVKYGSTQSYDVKLAFCTMEDRNFNEAVKACEGKIDEVHRKQGIEQKFTF